MSQSEVGTCAKEDMDCSTLRSAINILILFYFKPFNQTFDFTEIFIESQRQNLSQRKLSF